MHQPRRYIVRRLTTFIAAILTFTAVAPGVTLQQMSLDDMTAAATAVVRARVTGSSASTSGRTIYTRYQLQVLETLKGSPLTEVSLPGGVSGGYRQSFPGVPELARGTEYVLFLWTSPSGMTQLIGMTQGIFNISGAGSGSAEVTRKQISETVHDSAGRVVQAHAVDMSLAELRERIRQKPGQSANR